MKVITSKDNRIYKQCKALGTKKHRDATGLYLVEGEKLVREACEAGMAEIVIAETDHAENISGYETNAVLFDNRLFENIAHTETSQGVLAVVRKKTFNWETFIGAVSGREEGQGNIIVLDRLQDPGNIGTIIRTADAAGYGGVISVKGTGDIYSPKVVRAAAGSIMRLPIYFAESATETVDMLKKYGKTIVGTALNTDLYYYDADLSKDIAIVIGNEGNGMSEKFEKNTDINVKIPMSGSIDSLNAAVAAGILMYQSRRDKR